MGRRGNPIDPVEVEALRILYERFTAAGWTVQELAERSGMGKTSAFKSIKAERSTTISDFEKLCAAFDLKAWRVLKKAQENLALPSVARLDFARLKGMSETEARLLGAARAHEPDPYAGLGEENQAQESED